MHRRLIVAFIVVALLAALASQWVINLALPRFPSLHALVNPVLCQNSLIGTDQALRTR